MPPVFDGVPEKFDTSDWYVKTEPSDEPVSLDEVKAFVKVDGSSEDDLLEQFIVAARKAMEGHLGRSLLTQTIVLRLDSWPENILVLPRPPLVSIVEVRTLDEDGTETAYSSDNYYVITGDRAQLIIRTGKTPPINTSRFYGGFEVEYTAGYGTDAADVPAAIRQALLQWIATIYETRVPDFSIVPQNVQATLGLPYKRIRV